MCEEIWKPVVGYEGYYSVSDLGRVRRDAGGQHGARPGHILKTAIDRGGYVAVALCCGGRQRSVKIHRLVMAAFVGARPPGLEINHRNANKTDNRLCNLEYVTPSENMRHAARMGMRPSFVGSANGRAKLTDDDVRQIKTAIVQGERQSAIARRYCVSHGAIQGIAHGRTWRHVA